MGLREDIIKQATEGADQWIEAHQGLGKHPYRGMKEAQAYMYKMAEELDWSFGQSGDKPIKVPQAMLCKLVYLGLIGRHILTTRMLALGIVSEDEIWLGDSPDDKEKKDGEAPSSR